jgi:hypothetical protein
MYILKFAILALFTEEQDAHTMKTLGPLACSTVSLFFLPRCALIDLVFSCID